MGNRVQINDLAAAVMKELTDYSGLAADSLKTAVKKAGKTVRQDIQAYAPKRSGAYAKSWTVKNVRETSHAIELVVHSKNRYQLAHLLEFGHAKRNGGRVPGKAHIAPAEEKGVRELEEDIRKALEG